MDFVCICGENIDFNPQKMDYEQDGDTIYVYYTMTCPVCGTKMRCREVFHYSGETEISIIE
jgi:uncharacterized protein (DUF2225 family)